MKDRAYHESVSDQRLCDVDRRLADEKGVVQQSEEVRGTIRNAPMRDKALECSLNVKGYVLGRKLQSDWHRHCGRSALGHSRRRRG